jgi:hypothetical protein
MPIVYAREKDGPIWQPLKLNTYDKVERKGNRGERTKRRGDLKRVEWKGENADSSILLVNEKMLQTRRAGRSVLTEFIHIISVCPCQTLQTPLFCSRSIPKPGLSAQRCKTGGQVWLGNIKHPSMVCLKRVFMHLRISFASSTLPPRSAS